MLVKLFMLCLNTVCSIRVICMCICAGEVMVCVLDFKRDVGLWHGVLTVSYLVLLVLHVSLHYIICFNDSDIDVLVYWYV